MASELRRRDETLTLTCDVFDLVLDESEREAFDEDPATILRRLIDAAGEGAPNGILARIDTVVGSETGDGPLVAHIIDPPEQRCNYVIFI